MGASLGGDPGMVGFSIVPKDIECLRGFSSRGDRHQYFWEMGKLHGEQERTNILLNWLSNM